MRTQRSALRVIAASAIVLVSSVMIVGANSARAYDLQTSAPDGVQKSQAVIANVEDPAEAPALEVSTTLDQARRMDEYAVTHFGDFYGGFAGEYSGNAVVLFLTRRDSQAERILREISGLPSDQLRFVVTRLNVEQQDSIAAGLTRVVKDLEVSGHDIVSWGLDGVRKQPFVTTINPTETQLQEIQKAVGNEVEVRRGGEADRPRVLSRAQDNPDWKAGIFIGGQSVSSNGSAVPGSGGCTAGIPVYSAQYGRYIVTAAHCFAMNKLVSNWAPPITGLGSSTAHIGYVTNRDGTNVGIDAELIFAPGARKYFIGGTNSNSFISIPGEEGSPYGYPVCHSGAYEGLRCTLTVQSLGCINLSYGGGPVIAQCHEVGATTNPNEPQTVGEGDSGGPTFLIKNGTRYLNGIVSALSPEAYCTNAAAEFPTRRCGGTVYYVDWYAIKSFWNLQLQP